MQELDAHFDRETSKYLRLSRFVTVCQRAGESYRDYLVRVERLSRGCGFSQYKAEELRLDFCLLLAVNGLNNKSQRLELMSNVDLTWPKLRETLLGVEQAMEAMARIVGDGKRQGDGDCREVSYVRYDREGQPGWKESPEEVRLSPWYKRGSSVSLRTWKMGSSGGRCPEEQVCFLWRSLASDQKVSICDVLSVPGPRSCSKVLPDHLSGAGHVAQRDGRSSAYPRVKEESPRCVYCSSRRKGFFYGEEPAR